MLYHFIFFSYIKPNASKSQGKKKKNNKYFLEYLKTL